MRQRVIIAVIILLGLAAAGWSANIFKSKTASNKDDKLLFNVKRGAIKISLITKGIFEPREVNQLMVAGCDQRYWEIQHELGFPFQQLKIVKVVPDGTRVKKGDIVAEFDSSPLEEHIKKLENQLTEAKNRLKTAEDNLEFQKRQLEFALMLDEGIIQTAKKEMDKYLEENPRAVKSKKIGLDQAKLELKKLREELVRVYEQVDAGKIPEDSPEIESKRLAVEQKQVSVETQEKEFKLFTEYTVPQEIFKREIDSKKAVATKEKDQKEGEAKIKQAETEITNVKNQIIAFDKSLKTAVEWRQKMVSKAPSDGLLLYGGNASHGWETSPAQVREGNSLYIGQPLVKIPSASEMKITLQLNEIEIKKVNKEMKAEIKPDAYPDIIIPGVITKVAEMPTQVYREGEYNSRNEQNYPVEILCERTDERLKPKMSAQVEIIMDTFDNAIFVPIEAIFEKDKKTICYLAMPDGSIKEQLVKLGKNNDDFVVVAEGLQENDKVYLYDPYIIKK